MDDWVYPSPFYPVATGVHMPHVGSDRSLVKPKERSSNAGRSNLFSDKLTLGVNKKYVKKISDGLSFSDDVVKERCFHLLPYSNKYLSEVLDATDIISTQPKPKILVGRHDARGCDKRHLPCHIEKRATHKLKPIKRKILQKALAMQKTAVDKEEEQHESISSKSSSTNEEQQKPFFMTEKLDLEALDSQPVEESSKEWDAYLMSQISETTARYVVTRHLSPGEQQEKLNTLLDDYYGPAVGKPDLVQDNMSEGEVSDGDQESPRLRKWKKADETLLDRIREMQKQIDKPTDPYGEDTDATFYRLPAGFRRAKKHQEKEDAGAINTTAFSIEVKTFKPSPPLTMRDFIHPGVGDKLFDTDNMFEREWLTGARQVHLPDLDEGNTERILLDTNNRYMKVLQKELPKKPKQWFEKEARRREEQAHKIRMYERGMHPWEALPVPLDQNDEKLSSRDENGKAGQQETAEKFKLDTSGSDPLLSQVLDNTSRRQTRGNAILVQIVNEWRTKWNLDMRYADATTDDLIRDMADIHPHIRLKAITTCARAAEYQPPPELGIQLETTQKQVNQAKLLPEKLFVALECLLEDDHEQVHRAAAIALYTLERPIKKAELILRSALKDASTVDRWAAVQCLAYYGECDSDVVGELCYQLLNSEDPIRHEQTIYLLASLSENSTLVHSMLGEQLNSSSWRHRVMVCKIMPKLHGQVNKDLVNKLTLLMWTDWHSEVRNAAAQTLGKTGHGKDVHDELRAKILEGNERARVEAVSKLGHLGIMTAKLLPAFLGCFHDGYVSVRQEACIACANLKIQDQQVLSKLIFLATFDPIWKVKALALQAIGKIGIVDEDVNECVLWALRYEDQPGVRAEACNTVMALNIMSEDVAQILQDRLLVETSPVVKEMITKALHSIGISATEDMDMVAQIKNEVRKLCTKTNICAQITVNEEEANRRENIQRMVYVSPEKNESEKVSPRRRLVNHNYTSPTMEQRKSFSQERSAFTPAADREVRAILNGTESRNSEVESTASRIPTWSPKSGRSASLGEEIKKETSLGERNNLTEDDKEAPLSKTDEKQPQVDIEENQNYNEVPCHSGHGVDDTDEVLRISHTSGTSSPTCISTTEPELSETGKGKSTKDGEETVSASTAGQPANGPIEQSKETSQGEAKE